MKIRFQLGHEFDQKPPVLADGVAAQRRCALGHVFAQETRYPELAIDAIRQSKCDVLLLSSEPYPFKQMHLDELKHQLPGTKVCLVNGEMFSWYGSLLMEAPHYFKELMAAIKA